MASDRGAGAGAGPPDRYAVFAGALDLLTTAAEATPLLLLVDDAHLLDAVSAEAIAFIGRRLRADGIALLVATEADDDDGLDAEEIRLAPLDAANARALLAARFGDALAPALEREVALASIGGAPIADVARRAFLGPRTARILLASATAKLGVESPAELAAALGAER